MTPVEQELLDALIAFIEVRADCSAAQAANGSAPWGACADAETRLRAAVKSSCDGDE